MTPDYITGPATQLAVSYSPWMIALSYAIASFGSYISLYLAQLFLAEKGTSKNLLHVTGAVVLGCTVWSMHFIAMLAYETNMLVTYDAGITAVSMLIAIVCAFGAFSIVRRGTLSGTTLVGGSTLLGLGIAGMHYTGMSAMQMDAAVHYTPVYVILSIMIAIFASGAALWLFFNIGRLSPRLRTPGSIAAALLMGIAICGMHYMGMKAATMAPFADCRFVTSQDFRALALSVAVVTCIIFATAIILAIRQREKMLFHDMGLNFPTRLVSLGLGMTLLIVLGLGISNAYNQDIISAQTDRNAEISQLSYDLTRLDTLMGRYTRRQIHGERSEWAPKYDEARTNLQKTLHSIAERFPDSTPEPDNYLTTLIDARVRLNILEADAIEFATLGRLDDADAILDGPDYAAQKDRYTTGARDFNTDMMGLSRTGMMTIAHRMYFSLYPVLASILILALVWYFILRALHNWRRETENARIRFEQAKLDAEKASAAKSDFLANMSHEIRSPMNAIMGLAQILMRSPLTPDQLNWSRIIHTSGENLLAIINDILDFSKMAAGKLKLEKGGFDLFHMVVEVTDMFTIAAHEKGLSMMVAIDPGTPKLVVGDAVRIRQILTNFVSNAVKFTQTGHIAISISSKPIDAQNAQITITVHDTGIGIPKDKVDYIFEKFSQVEETTTRSFGGTGLGLAICRSLARLMDGRVTVTSVEGQGSSFAATLPLGIATLPEGFADTSLKDHTALLIESYAPARENLARMLEGLGIKATSTDTPDNLAQGPYDVALLDSAFAITDIVRDVRRAAGDQTHIIVIGDMDSGAANYRDVDGVSGYLSRPFTPEQLQTAIKALLSPQGGTQERQFITRALIDGVLQPAPPTPVQSAVYKNRRILVVDDMQVNQLIMRKFLAPFGCTVDCADNGIEALTAMRERPYDMVFMDCQMPGLDGFETTRTIRTERPDQPRAPVIIALTADAMTGDREKCLQAGMNDYINKPFAAEQIDAMLKEWLD